MPTEELAAIKDTDNIKIILKVEDASETVPTEDKQRVETVLQENESLVLGQYLDVTLLKVINGSETKITDTSAPITVTFEIPENFRKANREFAVIRVHEDERTVLNDLDDAPDTVTIQTDKFSTYALAYTDKEGNPNTGVYVSIIPLAIASVSLGALAIKKNKRSSR